MHLPKLLGSIGEGFNLTTRLLYVRVSNTFLIYKDNAGHLSCQTEILVVIDSSLSRNRTRLPPRVPFVNVERSLAGVTCRRTATGCTELM